MLDITIHDKITGYEVEHINNISGDDDYSGWINTLNELLKHNYFSDKYIYHITYAYESIILTPDALVRRVSNITGVVHDLLQQAFTFQIGTKNP